jgi:hypothetical protein
MVSSPASSRRSVKLRLQESQSQKNTGDRRTMPGEPESTDLAIGTGSKANNLPFPSFLNVAAQVGLAHLPSIDVLESDLSRRSNSRRQYRLSGSHEQR